MAKTRTPAIEGWFTLDEAAPALIGTRCGGCGTYFFPKETVVCRNPRCFSTELEEVELSRRGRVWSFTNNCYPLETEKMVVLGQVAGGIPVEQLEAGLEVELVLDTLFEDDDNEYLVWKWRPTGAAGGAA